jgi:hypothetical protein
MKAQRSKAGHFTDWESLSLISIFNNRSISRTSVVGLWQEKLRQI